MPKKSDNICHKQQTLLSSKSLDTTTDWSGFFKSNAIYVEYDGTRNSVGTTSSTESRSSLGNGAYKWTMMYKGEPHPSIGLAFIYNDGTRTLEAVDIDDASLVEIVAQKIKDNRVTKYISTIKEPKNAIETDRAIVLFQTFRRSE